MEAEGLINALNDFTLRPNAPNFDPIMTEAIRQLGNTSEYPLNECSIKAFLAGYHFDRRSAPTTEEVLKYSNEVSEVYKQLFQLRKTADMLKKTDEHQSGLVMLRIKQLSRDLKTIVERGRIPSYRYAEYCQLNTTAIVAALIKAGLDGPLRYAELWSLIKGVSPLYIQVQKVRSQNAEGVEVTEEHYYAQLVPGQGPSQVKPELTDNPIGFSVQDIIVQLKNLRSYMKTNQKNENCAFHIIYEDRLKKAINDLRTENNYPY